MNRKAFTLIEIAIVLTIIGIVLGAFIPFVRSIYKINKITATKTDLKTIKNSLIAYSATRGYLPKSDTNLDGVADSINSVNKPYYLPYIDINSKKSDSYSKSFRYDVVDSLTTSSNANICSTLYDITTNNTELPFVIDENNLSGYSVAAVIISTGINKELTGNNAVNDRTYEMNINKYNSTSRDDIVEELTVFELISEICDMTKSVEGLRGIEAIKVYGESANDGSANISFYYKSSIKNGCVSLSEDDFTLINPTDTVLFYPDNDENCSNIDYLELTYNELREIDEDSNNSQVIVNGNLNNQIPTINDY